jgi:hypothetical protein|nr:MAG TPA: hypothetical protein [Caudoviricetes sp.]
MRILDENDVEIFDPDMENGYVYETTVVKPDATPIDDKEKFAWYDSDYEEVLRYVSVPKAKKLEDEINSLKAKLDKTDYISAKATDSLIEASGIEDVIDLFSEFKEEYGHVLRERRLWRERINDLEHELARVKE